LSELSSDCLPPLAAALIQLRGETLSGLARDTGIRAANLSVWLRGRPQVISNRRVAVLMDALGIRAGQLRAEGVHSWQVAADLAPVRLALNTLLSSEQRAMSVLYQGEDDDLDAVAWMRVPQRTGDAWISLTSLAIAGQRARLVAADLGLGKELRATRSLKFSASSPQDVECRLAAVDGELAERVEGRMKAFDQVVTTLVDVAGKGLVGAGSKMSDQAGWEQLKGELTDALTHGMTPDRIAAVLRQARSQD
jgi:hypothetical protein